MSRGDGSVCMPVEGYRFGLCGKTCPLWVAPLPGWDPWLYREGTWAAVWSRYLLPEWRMWPDISSLSLLDPPLPVMDCTPKLKSQVSLLVTFVRVFRHRNRRRNYGKRYKNRKGTIENADCAAIMPRESSSLSFNEEHFIVFLIQRFPIHCSGGWGLLYTLLPTKHFKACSME